MMQIKIKYHADIEKIKRIESKKSDWIDLRAAERVVMKRGDYRAISLGIGMELPEGYEAHIRPRSSTFKNFGIIMACSGIIDNAYHGDNDVWMFGCVATRDAIIEKNDRICQFRIIENQPEIKFEEVEHLENKNRGGFGSTGTR